MDRDDRGEGKICNGEVNPDHPTIFLEGRSSLHIVWELRWLSVAAHRLFDSMQVEERDFRGCPKKIWRGEGVTSHRGDPFTSIFWLPDQSSTEGKRENIGLLPGKIASDRGYPGMSYRPSSHQPDDSINSKEVFALFSNGGD